MDVYKIKHKFAKYKYENYNKHFLQQHRKRKKLKYPEWTNQTGIPSKIRTSLDNLYFVRFHNYKALLEDIITPWVTY